MAGKKKMQRKTLFSAIITLLSFAYKATLSFLTMSMVLMVASISTLMVFICKALFVKNVLETREKKKKAYLFMAMAVFLYSLIFIAFVVLKVNDIDISREIPFDGLFGILFIGVLFVLFILSIIGLRGALEKTDIMVIGLKEMTFVSALADLVIIEEFASIIVLKYVDIEYMPKINGYFSLGVGALMIIVSFVMFVRFARYKSNR
ncbi:MAG: hypothetical protein IKP77_05500 [Acholeplasmatales bacterium]|nr:hypothetical protein [Acholeplasmatales bacterium]